jgi:hypothetical protein
MYNSSLTFKKFPHSLTSVSAPCAVIVDSWPIFPNSYYNPVPLLPAVYRRCRLIEDRKKSYKFSCDLLIWKLYVSFDVKSIFITYRIPAVLELMRSVIRLEYLDIAVVHSVVDECL